MANQNTKGKNTMKKIEIDVVYAGGNSPGLPGYIWGMVEKRAIDLLPICGGWKKTTSRIKSSCKKQAYWSGKIEITSSEWQEICRVAYK